MRESELIYSRYVVRSGIVVCDAAAEPLGLGSNPGDGTDVCSCIVPRESLLKRHENDPFLKRIITGDEKWVVYNNVKRKRSWSKKDEPA
ncbi:hypothetical protein TNCV_4711981 [Trichonephila clavipes]|nr:hypothetical protein TNCV_4711981 [Trichonephila clavipes]